MHHLVFGECSTSSDVLAVVGLRELDVRCASLLSGHTLHSTGPAAVIGAPRLELPQGTDFGVEWVQDQGYSFFSGVDYSDW